MTKEQAASFEQMGIASLLPGMRFMLERMKDEISAMEHRLLTLQHHGSTSSVSEALHPILGEGKRLGRPPGSKNKTGSSWANMTPEERSAEMRRRFEVRKQKEAKAQRAANARNRWQRMTKAQRAEWQHKMAQGKRKAGKQRKTASAREAVNEFKGVAA